MTVANQPNVNPEAIAALQNITRALNNLAQQTASIYAQISNTVATSATAGTQTLPANPTGFANVTIGGTAYKIPLYKP